MKQKPAPRLSDIGEAAIDWVVSLRTFKQITAERNALDCVSMEPYPGPCWNSLTLTAISGSDDPVESYAIPRERWCEPCQKRQRLHEQRNVQSRFKAAKLRKLRRLAEAYCRASGLMPDKGADCATQETCPSDDLDAIF